MDSDGDGYGNPACSMCTHPELDCNDLRSDVYPGAPEACDGIDNQCPGDSVYGEVDEGCDLAEQIADPYAEQVWEGNTLVLGPHFHIVDDDMNTTSYGIPYALNADQFGLFMEGLIGVYTLFKDRL